MSIHSHLRVIVFLFICGSFTHSAYAQESNYGNDYYVGGSFHQTLLTELLLNVRFGWSVRGGKQWKRWGVFVQVEQDLWVDRDFENGVTQGVLNPGIGAEYRYANGFMSSSVAAGPSILLFDTDLDDAGQIGVFFDLRPTALRFQPFDRYSSFVLKFEPLTFTLVAPVLSGIPLLQIEHRTVLTVEFTL